MKFTSQEVAKIREVRNAMNTKPDKIRTWWKNRHIEESIAETVLQHVNKVVKAAHFYGMQHPELDLQKMLDMARFHDTAEYKEADYVPQQYGWEISPEEKHSREKAFMMELKDFFWEKGQRMFDLWMEFETGKTLEGKESPEAKIVKQYINAFDQYYALLRCNGDETVFKENMKKYSDL